MASMDRAALHFFVGILSLTITTIMPVFGGVIVTRPGISNEECSQVCLSERQIECRYYKFDREKASCILSTDRDPTIADLRKADRPEPGPVKKPASSWISQLQARILALEQRNMDNKNLHRAISDLRAEVTSIKNSRALTHHLLRTTKEQTDQNLAAIDEKTQVLKAESKRVEDAVMTLGELQKTFGGKLRKLNEAQKGNDLTMAMLSQSSKDIRSSLRELASTTTELKNSMANVRKSVTELEVRFAGLSTDVMDKIASVDAMIGPELKEMRSSQTTLAQALSMLTKKIMELAPKIPALQKKMSKKEGVMSSINEKLRDFRKQISFFNERLSFAERQMRKAIDPASKLNTERRRLMIRLQGQLESLQDTQKRIQSDVLAEISDRTHLYKDLASLKVSRKAIVDKVISLESGVRNFRRTLRKLVVEGPRGKLVTNILNRQVAALRSLKALKAAQDDVQKALEKYKMSMLRTHKQLLERDRRRMINELAMGKMQARLVSVYRKLRWAMAHSVENGPVSLLIRRQKDTLLMMARMQKIQEDLRRDVRAYKIGMVLARKRLLKQQMQHRKDLKDIKDVKRKTFQLYKLLRAKMDNIEAFAGHDSLKNFRDIIQTQNAVINSLSNYKASLLQTQLEVETQKKRQQYETQNAILLHNELDRLRRRLALMQRGIPHDALHYQLYGSYPSGDLSTHYYYPEDRQGMRLQQASDNLETMRALHDHHTALRDKLDDVNDSQLDLEHQKHALSHEDNLATLGRLKDQHRDLRNKLEDVKKAHDYVDTHRRVLAQAANNYATLRALNRHHRALRDKLYDIHDAHDYLDRRRPLLDHIDRHLDSLRSLHRRTLRNHLYDLRGYPLNPYSYAHPVTEDIDNLHALRAINDHNTAVRDRLHDIRTAHLDLNRGHRTLQRLANRLHTIRTLNDHQDAMRDHLDDIADAHAALHLHRHALDGYKTRADFDALNRATQTLLDNQREVNELRRRLNRYGY